MAVVSKSENGNYPADIYIFGKGFFTGGELPIVENTKDLSGKVITTGEAVLSTGKNVVLQIVETGRTTFDLIGFMKENWKLLSIGAVALLVLIKD